MKNGDIIKYKVNDLLMNLKEVKNYTDARSGKSYLGVGGYSLEQVEILEILVHEKYNIDCYKVEKSI